VQLLRQRVHELVSAEIIKSTGDYFLCVCFFVVLDFKKRRKEGCKELTALARDVVPKKWKGAGHRMGIK